MLHFTRISFLFLLLTLSSFAWAGVEGQTASQLTDQELVEKANQFENFAQGKVQQFNRNHVLSKQRMLVTQLPDGSYKALYHEIDENSLAVKVRRSSSKSIPYVGIISYQEQIFEAEAPTLAQLDDKSFDLVQIIPNKHLFSYKQGDWQ